MGAKFQSKNSHLKLKTSAKSFNWDLQFVYIWKATNVSESTDFKENEIMRGGSSYRDQSKCEFSSLLRNNVSQEEWITSW